MTPCWRLPLDDVEHPVAAVLESWVQTETRANAIAPAFGVQRRLTRSVQAYLEQWLNLWGAASRGYAGKVSNQVASRERQVRELSEEARRQAVSSRSAGPMPPRAKAVDASEREPVMTDVPGLLERQDLRTRNGLAYVTGKGRPDAARTSWDLVWKRSKVWLWRDRWDASCYVAPVLIVHSLVSKSCVLDLLSKAGMLRLHVGESSDEGFSDDQAHRRGRPAHEPLSGPVGRRVGREPSGHGPLGSRPGAVPLPAAPPSRGVGDPTERAPRGRHPPRPRRGPADRHYVSVPERVRGARQGILEPLTHPWAART